MGDTSEKMADFTRIYFDSSQLLEEGQPHVADISRDERNGQA